MGRLISALASYVRQPALDFIAEATNAGIPLLIVDIDRTAKEQLVKIADHVSWTTHSKHEPQPPENLSEALDVVPTALLGTKFWSPDHPLWQKLGPIGEKHGFEWGGRWKHINNGKGDVSHFQWIHKVIPALQKPAPILEAKSGDDIVAETTGAL